MRFVTFVCLLLLGGSAGQTFAFTMPPLEGRVLEYDSERPIEGAVVVATWSGQIALPWAGEACVHAESAVSDKEGRFRMRLWSTVPLLPMVSLVPFPRVIAYKAGWEKVPTTYSPYPTMSGGAVNGWAVIRLDRPEKVIGLYRDQRSAEAAAYPPNAYMKPASTDKAERLEHLLDHQGGAKCLSDDGSERNIVPLLLPIFREARALATTKQQLDVLEVVRRSIARRWVASTRHGSADYDPLERIPPNIRKELE